MCFPICQSQQPELEILAFQDTTSLHFPLAWVGDGFPYLSHELLGGQDKFMVEQPAWLFLKEGGVGMNEHCLLLFHCAIAATSQPCCVVKVTSSDGLRSRKENQWESKTSRGLQHSLPFFFSSGFWRIR